MLSNLEQHFTVESLHHEIPPAEDDDVSSSSSDDSGNEEGQLTLASAEVPWTEEEVSHDASAMHGCISDLINESMTVVQRTKLFKIWPSRWSLKTGLPLPSPCQAVPIAIASVAGASYNVQETEELARHGQKR